MVGASVVGVRAQGATSQFDGVTVGLGGMQAGCEGETGLSSKRGAGSGFARGDGGFVGRNSLALGMGPIDESMSVAQSNRACSRGTGLTGVLAVVDRAWSRSSVLSCLPTPLASCSLPTACSSLFRCSIVVVVGFEFVVVVVVVRLAFDRAGTGVTCRTSLLRLRHSEVVVVSDITDVVLHVELPVGAPISCEVSASRITNAARTFAIAFRIPSGKGPDRVNFQSSSICRSRMSHCATVLSDMADSCGWVGICCAIRAVCANRL